MKLCRNCNQLKNETEFYSSHHYKDGHTNVCKDCIRTRARNRARKNPVKSIQDVQAYRKTAKGKLTMRKARMKAYYRYPDKEKARVAVRQALASGVLVMKPCEVCGDTEGVEFHHDDYKKPLEVRCLCPVHHKEADKIRKQKKHLDIQYGSVVQ